MNPDSFPWPWSRTFWTTAVDRRQAAHELLRGVAFGLLILCTAALLLLGC